MNSALEAIVLCGGLGTRLRSLYADLPKALVPIHGRPFIEYQIEFLRRQGIQRIHLAAGYRAGQLKEWADTFLATDVELTVSVEPEPLGTAGGIKFALSFLSKPDRFFALNGDSLLPHAQLNLLSEFIRKHGSAKAVLAAVEMTERGQYGTVEIDSQDRVIAFREKTTNDRGTVNGGIYYLDASIFSGIPDHQPVSIEKETFPALASENQLFAVTVQGPLLDMGTPEGLRRTEAYFSAN